MLEKQNTFEKMAVGDADMTDAVVAAAVAGMAAGQSAANGRPGLGARARVRKDSQESGAPA